MKTEHLRSSVFFLLALASLLVIGGARYFPGKAAEETPLPASPELSLALPPSSLEAKAAILYDPLHGKIVWEKNAERQLPLASLTKLATAALALDTAREVPVRIAGSDIREEGDSGLKEGETWPLTELVRFALRTSSNDAAAALARATLPHGASDMNDFAQALGLSQTFFLNPTGLDVSSSTAGGYGSALDVARLFSYIMRVHPEALDSTLEGGATETDHATGATAQPLADMPGLIGAKTGFTDLAGGNLAVAFERSLGRPLIAVVLSSSREGRFSDIRTIIEAARTAP